jgi:hypothetical protein
MDKTQTKELKVSLWLRVENNSKFVRGKTKVRSQIETQILHQHAMVREHRAGWDYTLTIRYHTDEELDKIIYDMLDEASFIADLSNCFIESDVTALDGSERSW